MKKQMLFKLELDGLNSKESLQKLEDLIAEGWFIKLATPCISFQATRSIIYVLEKEEEIDE